MGLDVDGSLPVLPPKLVDSQRGINVSFKRVASRTASSYGSTALDVAVASELQALGKIVFALVGTIGERETVSVPLTRVGEFEQLQFDPSQSDLVVFSDSTLSLRQLDGIDELWRSVETIAGSSEIELGGDSAENFDAAFTLLQEEAGRPVDIDAVVEAGPSILTEVLARVDEQVAAFKSSLDAYQQPDDADALSELLRISYNFADGAKSLLNARRGVVGSEARPVLADRSRAIPACRAIRRIAVLPRRRGEAFDRPISSCDRGRSQPRVPRPVRVRHYHSRCASPGMHSGRRSCGSSASTRVVGSPRLSTRTESWSTCSKTSLVRRSDRCPWGSGRRTTR